MQTPGEWLEASGLLGLIALISFLVTPLFRDKFIRQLMLGARN
jgi:subfamily B ATP-binding cassette protein HlyB/CyaB